MRVARSIDTGKASGFAARELCGESPPLVGETKNRRRVRAYARPTQPSELAPTLEGRGVRGWLVPSETGR